MIAAVCIDDRGGMLFNHRRQSQDRLLREDLLAEAAGRPLWMNSYSWTGPARGSCVLWRPWTRPPGGSGWRA